MTKHATRLSSLLSFCFLLCSGASAQSLTIGEIYGYYYSAVAMGHEFNADSACPQKLKNLEPLDALRKRMWPLLRPDERRFLDSSAAKNEIRSSYLNTMRVAEGLQNKSERCLLLTGFFGGSLMAYEAILKNLEARQARGR